MILFSYFDDKGWKNIPFKITWVFLRYKRGLPRWILIVNYIYATSLFFELDRSFIDKSIFGLSRKIDHYLLSCSTESTFDLFRANFDISLYLAVLWDAGNLQGPLGP